MSQQKKYLSNMCKLSSIAKIAAFRNDWLDVGVRRHVQHTVYYFLQFLHFLQEQINAVSY